MSRAASITNDPNLNSLTGLSSLSRQPLSPEQQLQALKRVQAQAEQRVKLGMQLFKAAEARLSTQTDVLGQIKTLQDQLREQVNQDVAKSLHEYDQWIGQIDESFTTAIRKLEEKIDAVQANIISSEARIQNMLQRAEALLDQNRTLVEKNSLKPADTPTQSPAPASTPAPKPTPTPTPTPTILDSVTASKQIAQNPNPLSTPQSPAEPAAADRDSDPDNEPHKFQPEQEKIYLTLLQRLMKDGAQEDKVQGTDTDTGKNITDDNTPEENASAA
jgi:hypothetical protein